MDENFLIEMAESGEKKFEFEIPMSMAVGDALNALVNSLSDVQASADGWKDKEGLKPVVLLELSAWSEIFRQALSALSRGSEALLELGDDNNAERFLNLVGGGNKHMHHVFFHGQGDGSALKMFLVFRMQAGARFVSSVDFG